jgi:SAM-dependent methyltransferase
MCEGRAEMDNSGTEPSRQTRIYSRQYEWRRWSEVYPDLGDLHDTQLLDVGCGIGDQTRDLARLGATVLGVDANQEAIDHARSRGIPFARFQCCDVRELDRSGPWADGVWTSFTAAYFPRFEELAHAVERILKPGGWLAITEVDDLIGHRPLATRWRSVVEDYYARSLQEGVHRFVSRAHVSEVLAQRGWRVEVERTLEDDEFCFEGPATSEVLDAWTRRLAGMMPRFSSRFGSRATGLDAALETCLRSHEHHSNSRVWFLLARFPAQRAI